MTVQKLFFPITGGNELSERIFGAFLVLKYFGAHLEILASRLDSKSIFPKEMAVPGNLIEEMSIVAKDNYEKEFEVCKNIFDKNCKNMDIKISDIPIPGHPTANLISEIGYRSKVVAEKSKFCDLVIVSAPPNGIATSTFEATVLQSGKPVLVIPRILQEFKINNIIIGWDNSPECSRALTLAIPIMKKAKKIQIISSIEYTTINLRRIKSLIQYLSFHNIIADYEIIKTTKVPGEALTRKAIDEDYDLIIAGAYGSKGLKEKMFGGTTEFLLKHTSVPTFMSH